MKSKLFVIGKPIKHSRSPTIHNFWIEKYSLNARYNKLEVDKTEIKDLIQKVRDGKIKGLNITIPYKKIMIDLKIQHKRGGNIMERKKKWMINIM